MKIEIVYKLGDEMYIWITGLGSIDIKCRKVITYCETGLINPNKKLIRCTSILFPNINHHFYVGETKYKHSFKNIMVLSVMKTVWMCILYIITTLQIQILL
jgi:hypothetical protein